MTANAGASSPRGLARGSIALPGRPSPPRQSVDEYRRDWLETNGISETDAVLMGLHFEPCDCGARDCDGWKPVLAEPKRPLVSMEEARRAVREGEAMLAERLEELKRTAPPWSPELDHLRITI